MNSIIERPAAGEFAPYYGRYIEKVEGSDVLPLLVNQIERTWQLLSSVDESRAAFRYAPDKWSIKQVVGHLSDGERVFAYRALRFARADVTPLPGFDENHFAEQGAFDDRPIADLVLEFRAVRSATIALFASLSPEALRRRGTANDAGYAVSRD